MKDKLSLIDTNILVYAYDKTEREKHRICRDLVARCWNLETEYAISLQNISEFYVIITRKVENPIPIQNARSIVKDIIDFNGWRKINFTQNTIISAMNINKRYKIHYWDALLAATMRENDIFSIYTENESDFKKIRWLDVINPIRWL
ncbi:MAG TPA: PIN domain-containing protein [Candidatus Altiarchaeales archaeon]|nr:PIN domain-containing protein [Candidatus Altiarchaeales archaeon]HEX54896.1 PIN domain-containing protein [Candidatus Altiarchaeales archaeon]